MGGKRSSLRAPKFILNVVEQKECENWSMRCAKVSSVA